ncbi:MAG TPA: metal-dependent transcriptional regulator [Gaiellaceae bacterium]|nr:metal-dependent transcriptional regulator [Gaiellaceae bacterium]
MSETANLSASVQEYVKELFKLQADGRASTSALAERMGVAPASATAMLKKLAQLGLVDHEPYRGARLTATGERAAIEMIRHHRLLEQYLATTLRLPLEAVHAEADRLEHALSEELEALIDESLGFPTHDPHGDPIPSAALELTRAEQRSLADVEPGAAATVRRVPDSDRALLHYLDELGLVPGERIEVTEAAPFGGPVTVRARGADHAISRELADRIGVD